MSVSQFKSPPLVEQFAGDEEEHLIGDNTKKCCLPILKGGNQKCISVQTVSYQAAVCCEVYTHCAASWLLVHYVYVCRYHLLPVVDVKSAGIVHAALSNPHVILQKVYLYIMGGTSVSGWLVVVGS